MLSSLGHRMGPLGAWIRAQILGVSIRTKMLGVLVVPMAVLLLASSVFISGSVNDAGRAHKLQAFTEVSTRIGAFIGSVQTERADALRYLSGPAKAGQATLRAHRQTVTGQIAALRVSLEQPTTGQLSSDLGRAAQAAVAAHDLLPALRADVDQRKVTVAQAGQRYAELVSGDLALPEVLADAVTDSKLAKALRAHAAVSRLQEAAAQERDAIAVSAAAGRFSPVQYTALAGSVAQQDRLATTLPSLLTGNQRLAFTIALTRANSPAYSRYRQTALASGNGKPLTIDTQTFADASSSRLRVLAALGGTFSGTVIDDAQSLGRAAQTRALLIATLATLAFAGVLLHALSLSRRIALPLRRLTDSAELLRAELPRMVERMQTPGERPEIVIEPIRVKGADEIGRLAQAFNTVNEVTVQVAVEQAALRGSIAEMFVNVARRNQALLGRQVAFLDQLEAREEDPDALQNLFRLDHLAAQMRHNAESLLVLAGIDATRALRAPVPLSDVLRTATGEIESFHRVELTVDADPAATGRTALSLAHMLAELLANATQFSGPDTRVHVTTSFADSGIALLIADSGLGMTEDELAEANHRLATPPATEIAVAQRLGFYVAGRIAQRLGARITLTPRAGGGTTAEVWLPPSVFEADTLPVTAEPALEPASAGIVEPPTPSAAVVVKPDHAFQPVSALPAASAEAKPARLPRRRHRRGDRTASPVPAIVPAAAPPLQPPAHPPLEPFLAVVQDILPGRPLRRKGDAGPPRPPAPPQAPPPQAPPLPAPLPVIPAPRAHGATGARPSPALTPTEHAGRPPAASGTDGSEAQEPRSAEAARTAMAELTTLSSWTYTPATAPESAAVLSRRTATATPLPSATPPSTAAEPRSPDQVRGLLSGFRAGVEKGRQDTRSPEPSAEPLTKEES